MHLAVKTRDECELERQRLVAENLAYGPVRVRLHGEELVLYDFGVFPSADGGFTVSNKVRPRTTIPLEGIHAPGGNIGGLNE